MKIDGNEEWVRRWERVGPKLEKIRVKELRALTEEQVREIVAGLQSVPVGECASGAKEDYSGMVEMERWFARLYGLTGSSKDS